MCLRVCRSHQPRQSRYGWPFWKTRSYLPGEIGKTTPRLAILPSYTSPQPVQSELHALHAWNLERHPMQLTDYLTEHHVEFERILHPPAFTAQKRARFLHVSGRLVAKSVLLRGPRGFVLAVLPATHVVNTEALTGWFGGEVRLATREEVSDVFRDCEWGSVSPFGTLYGLPSILDASVDPADTLLWEGH